MNSLYDETFVDLVFRSKSLFRFNIELFKVIFICKWIKIIIQKEKPT